jgi:hypothetical protein
VLLCYVAEKINSLVVESVEKDIKIEEGGGWEMSIS